MAKARYRCDRCDVRWTGDPWIKKERRCWVCKADPGSDTAVRKVDDLVVPVRAAEDGLLNWWITHASAQADLRIFG